MGIVFDEIVGNVTSPASTPAQLQENQEPSDKVPDRFKLYRLIRQREKYLVRLKAD